MTIKITILGTSDQIPTARRNHPAMLLTYEGENILIDCGEGTQRQFRKAKLNPCKITRILITHWHGDHILGLPGLLSTLALSGYNKTLFIYGPRGIKNKFNDMLRIFPFVRNYKIEIKEVSGKFLETKNFYLEAKFMTHGIACNAYSFVKKSQIRINKEKLKKSKLPSGPLLQKLKQGKNISYDGKKYLAKNLTYKEDDKKVSFILDTSINKNAVELAKDSDWLICESTFTSDLEEEALKKKHLTAKQAGEIAKRSKSENLLLMHISSRYEKNLKEVLTDAQKVFKKSFLAKDLDTFEI